jgi:rsbT co-antagonist protein RsbR
LVGVRPEISQTLVGLGIDLRGISTRATLADGLETALRVVRRQIVAVS